MCAFARDNPPADRVRVAHILFERDMQNRTPAARKNGRLFHRIFSSQETCRAANDINTMTIETAATVHEPNIAELSQRLLKPHPCALIVVAALPRHRHQLVRRQWHGQGLPSSSLTPDELNPLTWQTGHHPCVAECTGRAQSSRTAWVSPPIWSHCPRRKAGK